MEGNQSNHPLFVWSQGDPRLVDVDGGVILEVSDFYEEGNPKVFFDWLHSIESFYRWYSLSKEQKLFFKEAKLRGKVRI